MALARLHYAIISIVLILGALFIVISNLPPPTCGFQSCHGLELSCGPQPIQCELVYQYGDNCRQFARCNFEGNALTGSCQLQKDDRFEVCKACVQKCLQDFRDDYIKSFECEYKCTL